MPNPLSASEGGNADETVIFGQVRDPFNAAAAVLKLRHNDSALLFFGSRVPGTIPARAWSHVAVTRAPGLGGSSNQTRVVQVWINGTLRAETKADPRVTFELRELGVGARVCLDDIIVTRDNDGGVRPCGSHICLNDMTKLTSITAAKLARGIDISKIGSSLSVADNIAQLMSPTMMEYNPNDNNPLQPNKFQLSGSFKDKASQPGKTTKTFDTAFWFGTYVVGKGVEGPLIIGGGDTLRTYHNDKIDYDYSAFAALCFVGVIILIKELFFDVRSTQAFLGHFTLNSTLDQKKDGAKSQRRMEGAVTIWQTRTTTKSYMYAQALRRHYFDPKCNAFANWLDTWVGAVCFLGGGVHAWMSAAEAYYATLLLSTFTFLLVAFWGLFYFRFHPGLRIFTSTVWNAGPDLMDTITVMAFLMVCFALATHCWMGLLGSMDAYADLSHTFFTLMEMAFTGLSFDDFAAEGRGKAFIGLGLDKSFILMKYLLFWIAVIVFTIIMTNILIAVISDAYEEARGDRDETHQRISAVHLVWRKFKSVAMTPVYAYWFVTRISPATNGRETDSVGYLRWQRDWFALTPGGFRLVAACTNPFTLAFMSNSAIFNEVNTEDSSEMNDGEETKGTGPEGPQPNVAAAGILEKGQLEDIINVYHRDSLKGVSAERLLALFGKTWAKADVVQHGNVTMENVRRTLPDGWHGTSATERGCARAVDRSPKIIQMEKDMKSTKKVVESLERSCQKLESSNQSMVRSNLNLKSELREMKVMLRALLDQQHGIAV